MEVFVLPEGLILVGVGGKDVSSLLRRFMDVRALAVEPVFVLQDIKITSDDMLSACVRSLHEAELIIYPPDTSFLEKLSAELMENIAALEIPLKFERPKMSARDQRKQQLLHEAQTRRRMQSICKNITRSRVR